MNNKYKAKDHEYELIALTEWPENEWIEDYASSQKLISTIFKNAKNSYGSLLPLFQLLKPTACKEDVNHLSTDGKHLYFSPRRVGKAIEMRGVDMAMKEYTHQLLHIVLHGFLGNFSAFYKDKDLAWAIMDLMSERFVKIYTDKEKKDVFSNDIPYMPSKTDKLEARLEELLEKGMGAYHVIKDQEKSRAFVIDRARDARKDNHRIWNNEYKEAWDQAVSELLSQLSPLLKERMKELQASSSLQQANSGATAIVKVKLTPRIPTTDKMNLGSLTTVLTDIRSGDNPVHGVGAGGGIQAVSAKKQSKKSYTQTLREICKERETTYEDPDSINPMFYQYGLDLYGDVPLIEPLEENPRPAVDDLVIAIDTSGSCAGPVAEQFISETTKILGDAGTLGSTGHITFIECDYTIQNVREFENGKDMQKELKGNIRLSGWGGTSFVPVFDWIKENRIKHGKSVSALIYLTDGCGIYPEYKPSYPTYFVMPDMDAQDMRFTLAQKPWIHVLTLETENHIPQF